MASSMERSGETGLNISLEFPDAEAREDFEIAFRGWASQYAKSATQHRAVLAAAAAAAGEEPEVSGYIFRKLSTDRSGTRTEVYIDILPGW